MSFVNCWHENNDELLLMWREYSDISRGIAIKTNFASLCSSLICSDGVTVGKIRYVEYCGESYEGIARYNHLLLKQKMYSWEQEVRLIGMGNFEHYFNSNVSHQLDIPDSLPFKVDLDKLVQNIVVAPYAKDDFVQIIETVASRHGMKDRVAKSSLAQRYAT